MEINTIAITGERRTQIMTLHTPPLAAREVLVKVRAVALCTLEQRIFKGEVKMPLPCTGGHEVAGEIAALGSEVNGKLWKTLDRVAVRLLYSCGECHNCRSGRTNMCERAQKKPVREGLLCGPGGLCDYVIVDSSALYPIPDGLTYPEAALTEPLACVVHSIGRSGIALAEDVVVLGGGIMGQLHVMLAHLRGARVILSEPDPARREMALSHGADIAINPLECDAVQKIRELTLGRGADVVFNTTPSPQMVATALEMTGKCGRMVQYSSVHPDIPAQISGQAIHNGQITITGSISPEVQDFYTANRLLSSGIVNCKHLIDSTFPFEEAQQAFERAITPGTFRVVITN